MEIGKTKFTKLSAKQYLCCDMQITRNCSIRKIANQIQSFLTNFRKKKTINTPHTSQERHQVYNTSTKIQKHPPRGVVRKRCSENMQQIYRGAYFNKVGTSAWMFSCKFTAYFQSTFSQEHL